MQNADHHYSTRTLLSDLGTAEIFVVMLIRLRVAASIDPDSVPEDWRSGMRAAGVSLAGTDAFEQLMHLLHGVWRLPLDVRSLRCGGLGEGEALLLRCVGLLQDSRFDAAEQLLGRWLPPGTSRMAAQQAQRFARALEQTRLCLNGRVPVATMERGEHDDIVGYERDEFVGREHDTFTSRERDGSPHMTAH